MPDFPAIVRERLALPNVDPRPADDIRAELAAHLEDAYSSAIAQGHSEDEALRLALEQVTDWTELARRVSAATNGGGWMSHHMRSLWLPGLTMLGCAATILLAVGWLMPGAWWASRSAATDMMAAGAGILLYVMFGAAGAAWSRRAGGTWRERLGAGLLPLALHIAVVGAAILASIATEFQRHPGHALNPQLRVLFVFVVVPALALATGAAPFLRQASRAARA
ncbi:MAG: permease prefix domain 1-containing protein [Vicinamibacterales bacterium]